MITVNLTFTPSEVDIDQLQIDMTPEERATVARAVQAHQLLSVNITISEEGRRRITDALMANILADFVDHFGDDTPTR